MKDCPPGKYFCNKEKKCMPIPKGHYVGARGWLRPDPEDENGRKSKKNGNKNGNGHSGTNGSSSGNGNGNGNGAAGGGVSEDKKWIQKATKNMRKDKPCTGEKFGSETCPPGSKRYNLAKTFRKMAKEEVVDEMKISKYKKSTAEKMIDAVKKAKKRHDKATEKKPKTAPYAVMAQEYKPEGEVIEDWKPEIEVIDTKKRKKDAEKKRKEAEASLPPHLKLDVMKKAFASEEITPSPNVSRKDRTAIDKRFKGLFKKDLKGTVAGVNEMKVSRLKDNKGAASKVIDAMVSAARRDREAREKQREKKRPKAPYQMLAQEYVPENYVKDYEKLKKKIGSKEKHDKPALQEGDFKSFMASSQAAKDRLEKKIKDRKEKDAQYIDTKKKGVRFYDKRGKGRIRSGRKIYD